MPATTTDREAFAIAFREHVGPELRAAAEVQALLVALGLRSFADAHEAVWAIAEACGAKRLPDALSDEWAEWLALELQENAAQFARTVQAEDWGLGAGRRWS